MGGTLGQHLGSERVCSWAVRCQDEEEGMLDDRGSGGLEGSGCVGRLARPSGGGRKGQLPGVPGTPRAEGAGR